MITDKQLARYFKGDRRAYLKSLQDCLSREQSKKSTLTGAQLTSKNSEIAKVQAEINQVQSDIDAGK